MQLTPITEAEFLARLTEGSVYKVIMENYDTSWNTTVEHFQQLTGYTTVTTTCDYDAASHMLMVFKDDWLRYAARMLRRIMSGKYQAPSLPVVMFHEENLYALIYDPKTKEMVSYNLTETDKDTFSAVLPPAAP